MMCSLGKACVDRSRFFVAILFFCVHGTLAGQESSSLTGRELFERRWEINDPLCPLGDGLGPCFNAESCVACHNQVAIGGGGDNEHNVELLTLKTKPEELRRAERLPRQSPLRLHPDFLEDKATVVLHRFGSWSDYEYYRFGLLGIEYSRGMSPTKRAQFWASIAKNERKSQPIEKIFVQGISFQLTQRNTPALFGAGLIDAIPSEVIRSIEKEQAASGKVSGRVAPADPSRIDRFGNPHGEAPEMQAIGKFGWRGQIATLADFALAACANELGLQTAEHKQAANPMNEKYRILGPDLDQQMCQKLIEFVRELPRPRQVKPRDPKTLREVARGEEHFRRIGCNSCHQESVAGLDGIFSDFLLHDLGEELADPAPAMPTIEVVGTKFVDHGYFGGVVVDVLAEIPTELHQEWRTPPLWGVADSAPYLHDGRAKNLQQAILLHGGEAAKSKQGFVMLPTIEKEAVVSFLMTLRAPR